MKFNPVFEAVLNELRRRNHAVWDTNDGQRYRNEVLLVYARSLDRNSAEDWVQESQMEFHFCIIEFESARFLNAWFHKVILRRFLTDVRRRKNHPTCSIDQPIPSSDGNTDGSSTIADQLFAGDDTEAEVIDQVFRTEFIEKVITFIEELPMRNGQVVVGHLIQGYTFKELSMQFGIPPGTVYQRYIRGIQMVWQRCRTEGFIN